jgi:hypothetical protein
LAHREIRQGYANVEPNRREVVPLFAAGEVLARRALGETIPILAIRHEQEIGELLARVLLAHAPDDLGDDEIHRLHRLLIRR